MTVEPGGGRAGGFRPEIQALRAVAVLLVVLFHLWPAALPGGFVGVDVFFVISGFLITGLLLREVEKTGFVSLPEFWARRARRILPAALLVLAASALAVRVWLLRSRWPLNFPDLSASAVFAENWRLAAARIDYWNPAGDLSVVRHYWTLSLEEQLYIIWPLLIAGAARLASRRTRSARARAIGIALAVATSASLVYSLYATWAAPLSAFYWTPSRAWEFGAGGLLAWRAPAPGASRGLRSIVSWAGLLAIFLSAFAFSGGTPFPGAAALLPVAATAAVIWAGAPAPAWSPSALMKLTPVQSLGDLSYAVYLWHWPIIALLPEALGRPLNGGARLAVLAAVVLAAYLTKILVEDPVRYGRLRAAGPRRTFALALAGMAAVAVPAAVCSKRLRAEVARDAAAAASLRSSDPRCYGAAARNPEGPPCRNPELDGVVVPSALLNSWSPDPAPEEAPTAGQDDFEARGFGAPPSEARKTFVLVGDSHAIQMLPAFRRLADAMHWRGYGAVRCPAVMGLAECASWNRDLFRWLKAHPEADTLFTTSASPSMRGRVDGFVREWKALPPSIKRIVVIRDNPHIRRPDCLERAARDGEDPARVCFDARASALLPDTEVLAALRVGSPRVRVIDLTDLYCDAERCPHLIGGVRVYADRGHLTQEYAATLFPYILRRLLAGGAGICYKSFSTDR